MAGMAGTAGTAGMAGTAATAEHAERTTSPVVSPLADQRKPTYLNIAGAQRPLTSPVDGQTVDRARAYRKARLVEQVRLAECDAIVLYDPVNIRYALDISNMQVWMMHNAFHYAVVCADGTAVDFPYAGSEHLSAELPGVHEVRRARTWTFQEALSTMTSAEVARQWATEIASLAREHGGGCGRIAIDTCEPTGLAALAAAGLQTIDGYPLTERARYIKSDDELAMMRWTIAVADAGIHRMYLASAEPGRTELEIWAELHHENIRNGGEWIETRLLSSGPRTNPWFQEASHRVTAAGDLLAFDTDMIGPYGYCADVSRTWTVGHVEPTPAQRDLYLHAHDQIQHNASLLRAGVGFREIDAQSWPIPERFAAQNYGVILHGVGLADESPWIATRPGFAGSHSDRAEYALEAGMVVSVESYCGEVGGTDGVKLEAQYVITETGAERLDAFPWEQWY
jgi:Xaa-Pro aminopeptidase